jgi:hypothetical protein
MTKTNYLNNKDILKEIHKSKSSYCVFAKPEYDQYDAIIHDIRVLGDQDFIQQCIETRAEKLSKDRLESLRAEGHTVKADQCAVDPATVDRSDLVFRLMTWDHIPELAVPEKDPVEDEDIAVTEYEEELPIKYVKVNFPPFQHYRLSDSGEPICVGKSHWVGDLETGHYSRDHGQMTNKLATMFMKLCERYATRSNWRNYSYNEEMRSQALLQLSQIGLQFDESKSQNPFAYYTSTIQNSFTRVLNIEKRNQVIRDDIMEINGLNPSYTRQGMGFSSGPSSYEE